MNKDEPLKFVESFIKVGLFEEFLNKLKSLREVKPEQFINTLVQFSTTANESEWLNLMYRLNISNQEEKLLFENVLATMTSEEKIRIGRKILSLSQEKVFYLAENGQVGTSEFLKLESAERQGILENIKFTDEEINILVQSRFDKKANNKNSLLASIQWKISGWKEVGLFFPTPEPSGEELLKVALQKIIAEKKYKKPSELVRFVYPRIKKEFPKKPKGFTNEQVKEGVNWVVETRKKNDAKKESNDQRSRSRTNITNNQWSEFIFKLFGERIPIFTKKYQKKVNDEVRKLKKDQDAQGSSK